VSAWPRSGHDSSGQCQRCCRVASPPRAMRLVMVLIAAQPIMAPEVAGSRSQSRARRRRAVSQARVRHGGEDGAGPADELAGEATAGEDKSQHPVPHPATSALFDARANRAGSR
jgi:hypothetical protein